MSTLSPEGERVLGSGDDNESIWEEELPPDVLRVRTSRLVMVSSERFFEEEDDACGDKRSPSRDTAVSPSAVFLFRNEEKSLMAPTNQG